MEYVTRINLKTNSKDREKLIDFCLKNKKQYLIIGWSIAYYKWNYNIKKFSDFYETVQNNSKRINPVLNVFKETKENHLFWTRDMNGNYWICRAIGRAKNLYNKELDIGAAIPVEAFKVGLEVPGQIKATFNRPNGGTSQKIKDKAIIEYSKYIFNKYSNTNQYTYEMMHNSILDNLPDLELEELIIIYLQIEKNYYVLSNSIAKKSTTIKIECELISRKENEKAVVQVGGKNKQINALDYEEYAKDGYFVYLFAPQIENIDANKRFKRITKKDIMDFYKKYKSILPKSITEWENLFAKN